MKVAIIGKGGAGKTTISVLLIQALMKYKNVLAIDCDANKNLIDYLGFEKSEEIFELGDLKKEIFEKSHVAASEYERKYYPADGVGIFKINDEIYKKVAHNKDNLSLIELGAPKQKRVGVTGMCPYNETIKVYLSNFVDKADEIVWCDFAAGSEAAGKGIVASFDNIIIPLEPNSKNLDVAKDIYKTLKLIHFENVYFIANKISKPEDIDYINNYFGEKLNYVGIIPFSKEIMKSDITGNLSFEGLNEDLKNIFQNIANTILKFPSNRGEVLERLQKLDILKGDKKCH